MTQSPNNTNAHVGFDVSPVAGPVMLGYFFQFGLYGVLSSQVYIYHQSFPTDKRAVKILVYGIYTLATLQSVLDAYDGVVAFASHFGNIDELANGHLSYLAAPILTGAIALIVQSFYAFRIYILTNTRIFPAIIAILSIIQCGGAFAAAILEIPIGDLRKIPQFKRMRFTEGGWVVSSGLCDIIIAACMWYQVYGYSKTGISRKTQSLLVQVVRLIVGTGAMTATVAVAAAVLFGRFPNGVAYATPCAILAQLYSNSMLVVLNNRLRLKESQTMNTITTNDLELMSSFQTCHIKELESQNRL